MRKLPRKWQDTFMEQVCIHYHISIPHGMSGKMMGFPFDASTQPSHIVLYSKGKQEAHFTIISSKIFKLHANLTQDDHDERFRGWCSDWDNPRKWTSDWNKEKICEIGKEQNPNKNSKQRHRRLFIHGAIKVQYPPCSLRNRSSTTSWQFQKTIRIQ